MVRGVAPGQSYRDHTKPNRIRLVCPGVANLECGIQGFQVDEVMELLRCVRGKNIIGGDVVCLMPTKDSANKQTAHFATAVMFEILSLIADNQK